MTRRALTPLAALALLLYAAACAPGQPQLDPKAAWVLTGQPPAPLVEVDWLPDGTGLVVDGRWLLWPREARWEPLPEQAHRHQRAISPDGRWIATWHHDTAYDTPAVLRVGPLTGDPGPDTPLPLWLTDVDPHTWRPQDVQHALLWLSPRQIYVHQSWVGPDQRPHSACRVRDLAQSRWIWVKECIQGDFPHIWRLARGPRDWMAISSQSQGIQGMRLVRWRGYQPPLPPGTPLFDLAPLGWLQAQFTQGGAEVLLSTPCDLDRGGCQGHWDEPWRIYGWPLDGGTLTLLYPSVPPFSAPSPTRQRLAWPEPGRVCVSQDIEGHKPECFALPGRL